MYFLLCMFSANHTLMGRALVDATQSVVLVASDSRQLVLQFERSEDGFGLF